MIEFERLRTLYSFMAGVPEEKVDYEFWRVYDSKCGTVACAVGWACSYPEFMEQGLYFLGDNPRLADCAGPLVGWPAVCKFFGLTKLQAWQVFGMSHKSDTMDVYDTDELLELLDKDLELGDETPFRPYSSLSLDGKKVSHRDQILMRIRNFLLLHKVITAERCEELKGQERAGTLITSGG